MARLAAEFGLQLHHTDEQREKLRCFEKQYGVYSRKFDKAVLWEICNLTGLTPEQVHRWFKYQREKARKKVLPPS